MIDCCGCFTEMEPLVETHPRSRNHVGKVCPNCHRVYLDHGYVSDNHAIRLDTDTSTERRPSAQGVFEDG